MAGFGGFAGGLSQGLINTWRMQDEQRRTDMAEEREKRLNEISDLQIAAQKKAVAEQAEEQAFTTDSAKVLSELGNKTPYEVGGVAMPDKASAEQGAVQQRQANLRSMDNAMDAFAEGKPLEAPKLRDDQVSGGQVFGKTQAFGKLNELAGKYTNLGAAKAQSIMRAQHAQKAFETIQRAAMIPNDEEAVDIIMRTFDAIPDGRKVVYEKTANGVTIGYRDEATGKMVGQPTEYKSLSDLKLAAISSLTPEGLTDYYKNDVKSRDLDERADLKFRSLQDQIEQRFRNQDYLTRLRDDLKDGRATGGTGSGGGGTGGGSAGSVDDGGIYGPLKNQKGVSDFVATWVGDQGAQATNEKGEPVELNPLDIRNTTERHLMQLLQTNKATPAELADIAYERSKAELSGAKVAPGTVGSVSLTPNEDGRWVRTMAGRNGAQYRYGKDFATDEEAAAMNIPKETIDKNYRVRVMTAAKPFARAETDPAERARLVSQLGSEAKYNQQRSELFAEVQRLRDTPVPPPTDKPVADPTIPPVDPVAEERRAALQAAGFSTTTPAEDAVQGVSDALTTYGKSNKSAYDTETIRAFSRFKENPQNNISDAHFVAGRLKSNPELARMFDQKDLRLLEALTRQQILPK